MSIPKDLEYVEQVVPMIAEVLVVPTTIMGEVFVALALAIAMLVAPTVFATVEPTGVPVRIFF